jgi:hypothetical protein
MRRRGFTLIELLEATRGRSGSTRTAAGQLVLQDIMTPKMKSCYFPDNG